MGCSSPAGAATCCRSSRPARRRPVRGARGRRAGEALDRGDALTAAACAARGAGAVAGSGAGRFRLRAVRASEIARLEESRLAALEDRIDADLALGEHARLVGELEGLVREHPLRERLRGQLMLALYRSGRQADALEAYRDARRELRRRARARAGARASGARASDPGPRPGARSARPGRTARPRAAPLGAGGAAGR